MRSGLKSSHRTLVDVAGKKPKPSTVKRNEDRERVPPPKPKGRRR